MIALDLRSDARALPLTLSASPALSARAIATWRGRMVNEHGSSRVFTALAAQLRRAGLPEEAARSCEVFAEEERRHGVLCGAVVEALGAEALAPALPEQSLPEHEDVSPLEGVLRNVLSVSCLSESIAVALIGAERLQMPAGPLRDLLTQIYADEVGHARFGWQLLAEQLPSLDGAARKRLAAYLEVAFAHVEAHELSHLPVVAALPEGAESLGLCNGIEARGLFYATVEEVIVPRLEALGLAAARAWRAASRRAAAAA